ncbi:MAG: hypothetical protein MUC87_09055 [Bacteroidia bacterium]|jgi:hypothetical protein|nr:hypothetical protein [Bacteroidia bacterium]
MSITVGKYTFSSWLRKGIAAKINQTDNLGSGSATVAERATVPIDVVLNTTNIHKDFLLLGPGDVIGINPNMIVRTEPIHWITNFEPNYLAFIEFYDEDFIWRYTPAKANGDKLRPWLALFVLEQANNPDDSEFEVKEKKLPLPTVTVKNAAALPPNDQYWAWGHVHTNEGYANPDEFEEFLLSLNNINEPNADKIICRLMSPRKLKPNKAYRAFVVPAFETGRLAGLGADTSTTDSQQPSWTNTSAGVEFPFYHEWFFRTGENEDFESLVKLLEPRPVDKRVGIRDMDGKKPGFGTTTGTDIGQILPADLDQWVIGLEGALKSPQTKSKPETINTNKPFFQQLEDVLNFPEKLRLANDGSTDPVVCPPIYGSNHAIKYLVSKSGTGWLNQLNRDPRNRVPSGFGTRVIQKGQEDYVARSWEQVKKILEANRRIRLAAMLMQAMQKMHNKFTQKLNAAEIISVFSPVMRKVKGSPTTLHYQIEESNLTGAVTNAAFRRMLRPRGPAARRIKRVAPGYSHTQLIEDINSGKISAAAPKQTPGDIITDRNTGEKIAPLETSKKSFFSRFGIILLLLILVLLLITGILINTLVVWLMCAVAAVAAVVIYSFLRNNNNTPEVAPLSQQITAPSLLAETIEQTPPRPGFSLTMYNSVTTPVAGAGTSIIQTEIRSSASSQAIRLTETKLYTPAAGNNGESLEAANFRKAALSLNKRLMIEPQEKKRQPFNLINAREKLEYALSPLNAYPRMVASQVNFTFNPGWLLIPENLVPAMAYPDFDDPMYEKLRDISTELFLPNLNLIPPNTISLLITNPEFIESYMVGLNHEMGRELLWREYPTDQRGSYFRQFWNVKGIIAEDTGLTPEELSERYKDITPMDKWYSTSALGTHRNPQRPPGKQVVLVVRGELLKKYPNTIIYAQKAHIARKNDGTPDPTKDPVVKEVQTEAEMKTEIKFPIFRAEIDPDIRFFGFDMNIDQVKGDSNPQNATDDWGWYFIIQQMPGEPRFGMDVKYDPDEDPSTPVTWDDLSWESFSAPQEFINTGVRPKDQFWNLLSADLKAQWGRHSADMAALTFQKPVMIAVHAKEMLENINA